MPPQKGKRDKNEREIAQALVRIGATVQRLNGTDIPDLLVGYRGDNYLIEVKSKKGKLSDGQSKFLKSWRGQANVARSVEDAFLIIGAIS